MWFLILNLLFNKINIMYTGYLQLKLSCLDLHRVRSGRQILKKLGSTLNGPLEKEINKKGSLIFD